MSNEKQKAGRREESRVKLIADLSAIAKRRRIAGELNQFTIFNGPRKNKKNIVISKDPSRLQTKITRTRLRDLPDYEKEMNNKQ
jgi:hypothetical protein